MTQSLSSTSPTSLREALESTIGPDLAGALEKKGFERLTPVQEAVLDPAYAGRDLRISSQTGSGKTVAIGLVLRDLFTTHQPDDDEDGEENERDSKNAHPRVIVVTPTRELAKQVEEELSWLYASIDVRVASVTGGGGYRDELRAFRAKPGVIVGTPGRLLDHLKRGAIDASDASAVVLDEADRMLDMGFREDIEAILGFTPKGHRTHLMSATFPREVLSLANRVQSDPVSIEGTPLGTANADIEHLIHLVDRNERLGAIVNLLLENPGAQTMIFARTRADVSELAQALSSEGFVIAMLSGEMEQPERNRALSAFKRGNVDALVATDVAARGIDVQDVIRVIHAEPPNDADAYTHRSGRTGRAGKKGTSSVLTTLYELQKTMGLLSRARVRHRIAPLPTAESIRDVRDESLFGTLTADFVEGDKIDPRSLAVAERILSSSEPARAVGRLVALALRRSTVEPRELTVIAPPQPKKPGEQRRKEYNDAPPRERDRGGRDNRDRDRDRGRDAGPPRDFGSRDAGANQNASSPSPSPRAGRGNAGRVFVPFRVSWGEAHGADPRRLVAMMCRRGNIAGQDIGAIRIGRTSSVVEVASDISESFEHATAKPDPRDPRVHVRRWVDEAPNREDRPPPREDRAPPPPRELPAERPSKKEVAAERPSKREVAAERPSKREVAAERPSKREVAAERPSKKEIAAERPSKREIAAERPSKREVVSERPAASSKREAPAERLSKKEIVVTPPKRPARREVIIERAPSRREAERPTPRAGADADATAGAGGAGPPKKKKPWHGAPRPKQEKRRGWGPPKRR